MGAPPPAASVLSHSTLSLMYTSTSNHTSSYPSLHELQYDVYIFSKSGASVAPGEDFIHSQIPYNLSLRPGGQKNSSEFPESSISPAFSSNLISPPPRGEQKKPSGYSKLFSLSFLSIINRELDKLADKFRVKTQSSRSAQV